MTLLDIIDDNASDRSDDHRSMFPLRLQLVGNSPVTICSQANRILRPCPKSDTGWALLASQWGCV